MSFYLKNSYLYRKEFVIYKIDEAIHNGILRAFKHTARNKHKKAVRAIRLVVLMKILCISFLVCSNCQSDMKFLNVNHVTDYNLGLLLLFNPLLVSLVVYRYLKMLRRKYVISSLLMAVNSV